MPQDMYIMGLMCTPALRRETTNVIKCFEFAQKCISGNCPRKLNKTYQ